MNVTRKSQLSGNIYTMDIPITQDRLSEWEATRHNTGVYIQNFFSDLSADQREFILTGITPEEWLAIFGSEEDGQDDEYLDNSENYEQDDYFDPIDWEVRE